MNQMFSTLLAAALGGAIGAATRVAVVTFWLPGPWGIAALNILGSFGLGFVLTYCEGRSVWLVYLLAGGLLGALTTFSTFAADAVRLGSAQPVLSLAYVVGSVSLAIFAYMIGAGAARVVL